MSNSILFLNVENILQIHTNTILNEGGAGGVRDLGLLESAVAMPQTQYDGILLHPDLASMAAAYLFHISNNHAFVDGNKPTAVLAALVFLDINGIAAEKLPMEQALEEVAFSVSRHEMTKDELINWFSIELSSN